MAARLGHPTGVRDDPRALRWRVLDAELPGGRLVAAPGELGRLLGDGTITTARVEPCAVQLHLANGRSWQADGDAVRHALALSLPQWHHWTIDVDEDRALHEIAHDVITGDFAAHVASHGGRITLTHVRGDVVFVQTSGACSGCELASVTLHLRLEKAIRERYPQLVEVRDETANGRHQLFPLLGHLRNAGKKAQ
ncbi:NifU family protein [Luteococcus sp. OSA5]|uniref:NifU family protein n=1 Tax=Luteococcus sp. OSA5 TaxID=3401630 RepID=UPI003B436A6C